MAEIINLVTFLIEPEYMSYIEAADLLCSSQAAISRPTKVLKCEARIVKQPVKEAIENE